MASNVPAARAHDDGERHFAARRQMWFANAFVFLKLNPVVLSQDSDF